MDDLISKQSAIAYAISGRVRTFPTTEDGEDWIRVSEVRESLIAVPPAEPEQKTGKWICDKYYAVHVCSKCGKQALETYEVNPFTLDRDYDEVLSEYCPHCGARMLEVEDEDE